MTKTRVIATQSLKGEGVGVGYSAKNRRACSIGLLVAIAVICCAQIVSAQQLDTLNVSYASVTGSRIPLWIAKDVGLFEKYGLNVNLVIIAARSEERRVGKECRL